ncbi:MAG: hypothetical protein JSU59_11105 [Nitrospirota bacterium]|nr:MAG: hypothetical protein JSU59_11105 [Nitrospirota bacterium]
MDIRVLGILFVISGVVDFIWIVSYPDYALKVFGTTFSGWSGELVKYQHPLIHLAIGYGFWYKRKWAFYTYLVYLTLACLSEITTQMVQGYHPTRTTMVVISLLFGFYIVWRRNVFRSSIAPYRSCES